MSKENFKYKKVYFRGTNNIREPNLIKKHTIKKSYNHTNNKIESGLSVSDVPDVGKYYKYLYLLTGDEIGIGSDGEPLLNIRSLKFICWVKK